MVVALISVTVLTSTVACSGDQSLTCSDFLSKTSSEQLDIATRWGAGNKDNIGPVERLAGAGYQTQLLKYCPAHPTDMLSDLKVGVGVE